mmetsp:Transcript_3181/g.5356  ORF Transcript_3181/g.5356 Transcript_3181/m.5356 type:complete len:165 (-) Transcript_3181:788-1282(-)
MGNEKHEAHFVLDGGLVATLSLATCTLLVAGACARKQTRRELNKQLLLRQGSEHREGGTQDGREEDEEPNLVISEKLAVFIVFQATAGLLLFLLPPEQNILHGYPRPLHAHFHSGHPATVVSVAGVLLRQGREQERLASEKCSLACVRRLQGLPARKLCSCAHP